MGLLDRFKKKNNTQEVPTERKEKVNNLYDIKAVRNKEGKLQIDFVDKQADFKQFYDTTRLVINNERKNMGIKPLKECSVSWYGQSDAIMIDKDGNEIGRRTNYIDVLAEIDENLLLNDSNYCIATMKQLLDQKRVVEYLNNGLKEKTQRPCGNYIGGITKYNNTYKKHFNVNTGQLVHDSPKMVAARKFLKEKSEKEKQQAINEKQTKIERLQNEIDELSK